MTPTRQVSLTLRGAGGEDLTKIRDNCSALLIHNEHLWIGGDEGTCVDRFAPLGDGNFGQHQRFDLAPILNLAADGGEIDIEGLDASEHYLWLVGSHSLKREKAQPGKSAAKNRQRLEVVKGEPNRYTLARVPLDENNAPATRVEHRQAARLGADSEGNLLTHAVAADACVGPACAIPSKENGLDIEGLAVKGDRVFVGLRGPVVRGWAVILDLSLETSHKVMGLASVRKHLVQLEGLGVRDLYIEGQDLYILAGPSMNLDGPVFVFRWPGALDQVEEQLVWREQLVKVLAVPFGTGKSAGHDHAEGIMLMPDVEGKRRSVMVCYDSPGPAHLVEGRPDQLLVDVLPLAEKDLDGN
jgi:Protein of unknown function (DUF3616)